MFPCFPRSLQGPIVRYQDVANEIDHRTITTSKVSQRYRCFFCWDSAKSIDCQQYRRPLDNHQSHRYFSAFYPDGMAWNTGVYFSRSILIFQAIPIWRWGWEKCWALNSRKTLIILTFPEASANFGADGILRLALGSDVCLYSVGRQPKRQTCHTAKFT